MAFPYKHVLMIGASSGIGAAMADRLIQVVRRHGESKTGASPFDIGNLEQIPHFAADIMRTSPDIDCVFLNAGIQCRYDFSHPEEIKLAEFNSEMNVNFSSFVALTHAFLPFLMKRKLQTSFIFTGSNLAIVPASTLPAYSASKAALNTFVLCLRDQLRDSNVKVIELSPPPVQTELHEVEMGEVAGRISGWPRSNILGSIGPEDIFNEIIDKRRTAFESLAKMMRGGS